MEPIKSNHHPSQYPPLDLAKMKSQPFKLPKITSIIGSSLQFLQIDSYHHLFMPIISTIQAS
ncbi:hypothetical protein Hanom_Chr13g01224651 [Helianthus anomalus]